MPDVSISYFFFFFFVFCVIFFFVQAEDGIRDLVRSRGLGDVYKRQGSACRPSVDDNEPVPASSNGVVADGSITTAKLADAAVTLSLIHI